MKLYAHWARDTRLLRTAGGWEGSVSFAAGSNVSAADAQDRLERMFAATEALFRLPHAQESDVAEYRARLREILDPFEAGGEYARPICEEVLAHLDAHNVVTRNRVGAEVLNSENLCFIDIDRVRPTLRELLGGLFGGARGAEGLLRSRMEKLLAETRGARHGFRVYRTAAGFRAVAFGFADDPSGEDFARLCDRLDADGLYRQLCVTQRCFRARLTPKPHRVGMASFKKLGRFPYAGGDAPARVADWVRDYQYKCERRAVCSFLFDLGQVGTSAALAEHDRRTRCYSGLPLA